MRAQSVGQGEHLLVFEAGEEVVRALSKFAAANRLEGGRLQGIGGFRRATIAFFEVAGKQYRNIAVDEQVEVLSLTGNISRYQGQARVHAHVVLGRADGSTLGGHLVEGEVRPTLELFLAEAEPLERAFDEASGLPLLKRQGRRE